jgi:hypothetical protein
MFIFPVLRVVSNLDGGGDGLVGFTLLESNIESNSEEILSD